MKVFRTRAVMTNCAEGSRCVGDSHAIIVGHSECWCGKIALDPDAVNEPADRREQIRARLKTVGQLTNSLVLASLAKARNASVPTEDRITDADLEAIEDPIKSTASDALAELEVTWAALDARAREMTQMGAVMEAMTDAAQGKPVSDFMESFPGVRAILDVRAELDAREALRKEDDAKHCPECGNYHWDHSSRGTICVACDYVRPPVESVPGAEKT
jgi:hypothetical protein